MEIREARQPDSAAIRDLVSAAFRSADHSSGTEAAIVEALQNAGALTLSLVAEMADGIAGHIAFSPVTIDGAAGVWYGLGPVSVRPDRQRQGIGTALIDSGLDRLRKAGARGCVVLGNPGYYRRFGFVSDPALRLEGVPPEYFMRLILAGPTPSGLVAYHGAFSAG